MEPEAAAGEAAAEASWPVVAWPVVPWPVVPGPAGSEPVIAEPAEPAPREPEMDEPVITSPPPVEHEEQASAAAELTDKPVLEWTTEDWTRWIEAPPAVSRPAPEADLAVLSGAETVAEPLAEDVDASVDEAPDSVGTAPEPAPAEPSEARPEATPVAESNVDADATGLWSIPLDQPEEEEDARWWSSVAGLADPPVAPTPSNLEPPVVAPATLFRPVPPPVKPPAPRTPPPATAPLRPAGADILTNPSPSSPQRPVAVPSSLLSRGHGLETTDVAVRVRAGLSLLGVSVLVGAVAAGLITVAIFMAAVVLRRALG